MTESAIIHALKERQDIPTVNAIISEFHCGYQMAVRIWEAVTTKELDLFL